MSVAIDRAAFLSGNLKGRNLPIRPPWSIPEMEFRETCNSCGDCLKVCKTQIIEFGRGRLPQINFNKGECIFCGDCVEKCSSGSLNLHYYQQMGAPWTHKVQVTDKCLNNHGVLCRSCGDRCPERAIIFRPQIGGNLALEIETESCSGCGACVAPCPVQAVVMAPAQSQPISLASKSNLEICT